MRNPPGGLVCGVFFSQHSDQFLSCGSQTGDVQVGLGTYLLQLSKGCSSEMLWTLREKASFPPNKSDLGGSVGRRPSSGQWGRLMLCPGGEGQVEMSKGVLEGGRAAMDALPGQGQRQRGLSPRGSGLKLKEPNFP